MLGAMALLGVAHLLESVLDLFKVQGSIPSSEGKAVFPRLQAEQLEQRAVETRAKGKDTQNLLMDSLCLLTRGLGFNPGARR